MVLAVEFADFGFGTMVGAVVASFIAIFLDHRRREDEKKRLFLEQKRLLYRSVSQAFDTLADGMVYLATVIPYLERLRELEEELEPKASTEIEQFNRHFSTMVAKSREQIIDNYGDYALLVSRASAVSAENVLNIALRMHKCMTSGEYGKVIELRKEYDSAAEDFRVAVRQDLEIDA